MPPNNASRDSALSGVVRRSDASVIPGWVAACLVVGWIGMLMALPWPTRGMARWSTDFFLIRSGTDRRFGGIDGPGL